MFFVSLSSNLLVVLPFGIWLHLRGGLGIADLVLFCALGAGLTAPLLRVLQAFAGLPRQLLGAGRISAVLDAPELPRPARTLMPRGSTIAFDRVRFGYAPGRDVLSDLTLTVPEGGTTALIGPSGAGKSTVIRLAARYRDVCSGSVRIGGADVRDIDPDRIAALVSSVFQDPFIFHGTIRCNLLMARPGATAALMDEAIHAAGLAPLLSSLPRGLDTEIGDRGGRLSVGERQRLAIARALLKDAPILLLDEATAYADPENERVVRDGIAKLAAGRTVLVIAHRIGTIETVDRIAVLVSGQLEAVGRHDELLATSEAYRRLRRGRAAAGDWTLRRGSGGGPDA